MPWANVRGALLRHKLVSSCPHHTICRSRPGKARAPGACMHNPKDLLILASRFFDLGPSRFMILHCRLIIRRLRYVAMHAPMLQGSMRRVASRVPEHFNGYVHEGSNR